MLADTQAATIMKTGGLLKARLDRFSMKLRLAWDNHDKLKVWRVVIGEGQLKLNSLFPRTANPA